MLSLDSSHSVPLSKWRDIDTKALVLNPEGKCSLETAHLGQFVDARSEVIREYMGREVMIMDSEQGRYVSGVLCEGSKEGIVALRVETQQGYVMVEVEHHNIGDLRVPQQSH